MNEQRLRDLMNESVNGLEASDTLRARVSAATGGHRVRRRTLTRGWVAVAGVGLAAAAVLLAVPLIRTPSSAPSGPGVGITAPSTAGATPVDDIGEVLENKKWYVIGIVAHGSSLVLDPPPAQAVDVMHIQLTRGILQGGDGCNALGSDPALLTSVPTVRVNISSTAALCTPVPSGQDEFLAALRSGPKSWSREGDVVMLTAAGIEVSFSTNRYTRPSSSSTLRPSQPDVVGLLGTKTWYVTHILASRAPVQLYLPTDPERAMRIGIKRGSLEGFDGCNWLGASPALLSEGADETVALSANEVGCTPRPDGQDQFLEALRAGDKVWSERDGDLVLRAGVYEITFRSTPATSAVLSSQADVVNLFGSQTWYVTGILAVGRPVETYRPADPEVGFWLRVHSPTVMARDGCNELSAPLPALMGSSSGKSLWGATDVECTGHPGQGEFVAGLTASTKSWFASGEVIVLQAAGYEITFSSKAPAPSAASTTTG